MSLKEQIGDLLEETHKLRDHIHTGDGSLIFADVELKIHKLRQTLEERKDYERDNQIVKG